MSQGYLLSLKGLETLFLALKHESFQLLGPTLRDGAILYDEISGLVDLPQGFTEVQEAGTYRVVPRKDKAFFGYQVGPHSWKKFLHPPRLSLFRVTKKEKGFEVEKSQQKHKKYAFIGVRSCDLHAIQIQDQVFLGGKIKDPHYALRRKDAFMIGVNCIEAGKTCFCKSMQTGPEMKQGYDLLLTELLNSEGHQFLLNVGSERGSILLEKIPHEKALENHFKQAQEGMKNAESMMIRHLDGEKAKGILSQNLEHKRWDEVAQRCLACTNCTMVCPTCFCTAVEDVNDLENQTAERVRRWDSCFTMDFSYIHGGHIRSSIKSRYRQWLSHKLATWHDQFGSSGCVGCGRCIAWCPVGIDLTEEVAVLSEQRGEEKLP